MVINFNISLNKFLSIGLYWVPLTLALGGCGAGSASGPSPVISGDSVGSVPLPHLKQQFTVDQSRNNQGLAFGDGYYYVSYDVSGKGYLERYSLNGVLDPEYGRVSVATGHSAEVAYRAADKRLYVASGGGTSPTYVSRMSADGKSVDRSYNFSTFGNSALLAIDNAKDVLIVSSTQTGGDTGPVTFRFIDWNNDNKIINQFTISSRGIPQGLEVYGNVLYYYTNNKITLLNMTGTILDEWQVHAAGESEGMTLVSDGSETYLAVGYSGPRRVYALRPVQLATLPATPANYVFNEE